MRPGVCGPIIGWNGKTVTAKVSMWPALTTAGLLKDGQAGGPYRDDAKGVLSAG